METFTRDGLVFDVTDAGSPTAEPVVLLHGFPQRRSCWSQVSPHLVDAGYRTLAPDQRGYSPGARPAGRRAYVIAELVDDVLALLDHVGAERVHLVGHDWGAVVGWALAARHADRFRTFTAVSVPHPLAMRRALPRGQALKSWYIAAVQLPVLPELLLARHIRTLDRDGLTAALNWYRALPLSGRGSAHREPVAVPTLFVWSDLDRYVARAAAVNCEHYVRGSYRFEVLTGVSHWIPETRPDQLSDLLLEHFAAHA